MLGRVTKFFQLAHVPRRPKIHAGAGMRLPIEIPKATRNDLPRLFEMLGFTKGVEIGTWKGEYAETLCRLAPSVALTCVDPWKTYPGYFDFDGLEQARYDNIYKRTARRLSKYNARLLRKTSAEALADFADASLDFVYIDGNHELSHVVFDLVNWARKVKPGGIIAGHDYVRLINNHGRTHVVEAVQAVADSYHIHPVFLLGLRAKEEGILRDRQRSFFWINP